MQCNFDIEHLIVKKAFKKWTKIELYKKLHYKYMHVVGTHPCILDVVTPFLVLLIFGQVC